MECHVLNLVCFIEILTSHSLFHKVVRVRLSVVEYKHSIPVKYGNSGTVPCILFGLLRRPSSIVFKESDMHTIQFSKEAPHLTLIAFFRDPSRVERVVIYSVDVLDFKLARISWGLVSE